MIEYIKGTIIEINPAHVVIDNQGIGYFINISLNTYSALSGKKEARVYIHEAIREDAHTLYGFIDMDERELFRMLVSVSGVGSSTGIVMLSSIAPKDLQTAIVSGDVNALKAVKGIGLKTAQRVIVELKDKLSKAPISGDIFVPANNTLREEALSALVTLGFNKKTVEKTIDKIMKSSPDLGVEEIVKNALTQM